MQLANNLKYFRTARGLTQGALAKLCGCERNYISNVEQATVNASMATLEMLAQGLQCQPYELIKPNPAADEEVAKGRFDLQGPRGAR